MPIPKPTKDEKEKDFISRCMGDGLMNREYPDQSQRSAICNNQWQAKEANTMDVYAYEDQLRLTENGQYRLDLLRVAAASISPGGYQGVRADIPRSELGEVKRRIREGYTALGVPEREMSKWVKESRQTRHLTTNFIRLSEAASEIKDREVEVTVIQAGFNSSREYYYPEEMLAKDFKVFEGLKMYSDHQTEQEEYERPEGELRNWVASLKNVRWDAASKSVIGTAQIIEDWFEQKLARLSEHGLLETMGVSIRAIGIGSPGKIDETETVVVESFLYGRSVDFVTEAGAGGKVLAIHESEALARDVDLIDVDALKERRPDLVQAIQEKEKEAIKQMNEQEKQIQELTESNTRLTSENEQLKAQIEEAERKDRIDQAQAEIVKAIEASELPEVSQNRLKREWANAENAEGIQESITAERDYIASLPGANAQVKEMGESQGNEEATIKESQKSLEESFVALGMSPEAAAIAARGR